MSDVQFITFLATILVSCATLFAVVTAELHRFERRIDQHFFRLNERLARLDERLARLNERFAA